MPNNTSETLSAKQYAPLTPTELEQFRDVARALNISPGLCARALLLWALDNIDRVPALSAAVDDERLDARARASDGARRAIGQRWN